MINELYKLSEALTDPDIKIGWHRKYKQLPKISPKDPCFRVKILNGEVLDISLVNEQLGQSLRRYGETNTGFFPGMNLAPLYRVTDKNFKNDIVRWMNSPEDLTLSKIENLCTEDNWNNIKFRNKFRRSMENIPNEILSLVPNFEPLKILIEESNCFIDPAYMHSEIKKAVFSMLSERRDVSLALGILFYSGTSEKEAEKDFGSISVYLETPRLIEMGIPAVSKKFVEELNMALISAEDVRISSEAESEVDAFGVTFHPTHEAFPTVKFPKGFEVSLRTMNGNKDCLKRYGKAGSLSYPLSVMHRRMLSSVLEWIVKPENEGKTWINIDKNEILFAYPSQLPETSTSYVNSFAPVFNNGGLDSSSGSNRLFTECAKSLISELRLSKEAGTDPNSDHLNVFILKKIDKARTKIVYTRQTDARELERLSEEWAIGCGNLPRFSFEHPRVIFPLSASDVLNSFWKQDGDLAAPQFKPIPKYHGIELLLEPGMPISADLHILAKQTMVLENHISISLFREALSDKVDFKMTDPMNLLSLLGMLLYRTGIRKETYMENLPYLFGQILKVSDELHALYCNVVRGDLPTQLAGSGVYQSAAEAPARTLSLLGTRMNPYITWAKTYRTKGITEKGKESWRAARLLSMYEVIMSKLREVWQPDVRFGDADQAQLFIGYLAEFPKSEYSVGQAPSENGENVHKEIKEESKHE